MKTEQTRWRQGSGWEPTAPGGLGAAAQLVLLFGSTAVLKEQQLLDEIKQAYPNAHLFGCSCTGYLGHPFWKSHLKAREQAFPGCEKTCSPGTL